MCNRNQKRLKNGSKDDPYKWKVEWSDLVVHQQRVLGQQVHLHIRRSRLVHIQKISAIFALNRTRSAAKGTELNYFVAIIITSHRIFTFPETCYIERTNSNGTARKVSKSRFYLISRAPPKYFSQQKARQVERFLHRLEGGYTIGYITG